MKVVIAVDGSHAAQHALRAFLRLATGFAVPPQVRLVAVVDYADLPGSLSKAPADAPDLLAEEATTALAVATELCGSLDENAKGIVLRGHVADEVLRVAEQFGADLVVVGTHGRKGVRRAVLGSTCESILRRSARPVLAVRQPAVFEEN